MKAANIQRERQQGLGRPITSFVFRGYRYVIVGNRLHWNKEEKWKTFNEFLSYYVKALFGQAWADVELKKPPHDRHPLVQWYDALCTEQRRYLPKDGGLIETPVTGAIFAYLTLAYNLYLIAHDTHLVHGKGVHARLIERLKNPASFYPAYYETMVAASFIKAGFQIELENEADPVSHHAEFSATSMKTNQKYSVEAKHRQAGKEHTVIRNQLYAALKKEVPHKRVVFIDLNIPDNVAHEGRLDWLDDVLRQMRTGEDKITIYGKPAPEAYVFVTNHPFLYRLESCDFPPAAIAEGFKIPDFKLDSRFRTLRDALNARHKHIDMFDLMKAMREYDEIPSTWDGEIPEYAFGEIREPRLRIGDKYVIPDEKDNDVVTELLDCAVLEGEKRVYCVHRRADGNTSIGSYELSDRELQAYRRYPDTFFGVYKKQNTRARDALELYDFFFGVYKNTPKEKLFEFLKGHPDIDRLKAMCQDDLAKFYCEHLVYSALARQMKDGQNQI